MNIIDWGTLIYNLIHSTIFWIVAAVWVIILIAWVDRSSALGKRISNLIKPGDLQTRSGPENVPLYPRKFFEEVATSVQTKLREPLQGLEKGSLNGSKITFIL